MAPTKKEVAKSIKTLIVMLQSLRDQQVTITLRNDTIVRGVVMKVDACMNIELKDATVEVDKFYCTETQSSRAMSLEDICAKGDNRELDTEDDHTEARAFVNTAGASSEDEETCVEIDDHHDHTHQQAVTCNNYFLVKGSRIRHIDLPSDSDLVAGAKHEIGRLRNRGKQWTKRDIVRS